MAGELVGTTIAAALVFAALPARSATDRYSSRDLDGVWDLASLTELERPEGLKSLIATPAEAKAFEERWRGKPPEFKGENGELGQGESEWWERDVGLARVRGQVRTSWIYTTADGQRPLNAAAKAFDKARGERRKREFDGPEARGLGERCLSSGPQPPISNGGSMDLIRIVQAGERIAIFSEWMGEVREVRIGGEHVNPKIRIAGGDSTGRWEGDTLVVETTNFTPNDIDAPRPSPEQDMRTVERFTRVSPEELIYDVSVFNPARDAQSWRMEMVWRKSNKALYEFACHEGNYSLPNILAGAREGEKQAASSLSAAGHETP